MGPEKLAGLWRKVPLVGDTVFRSWARHFTLTVALYTQVYKWVLANCWGNLKNCGGVTCDGLASRPGEVEILLAASCYRNRQRSGSYELARLALFIQPNNNCPSSRGSFRSVFQIHRNAVINEEQPRFQCKIISIANANTHCTHWLTLKGIERIRR